MDLQNFIQAASARQAQEILLGPDRPIQFRIGRDLINASNRELTVADSKSLITQILNEEEKRYLYQDFKVQGTKYLDGIAFKFDFQVDFSGVSGSLRFATDLKKSWTFPQGVAESLMRPQGLHIIAGPRRSGKSTAIADLLAQSKNKNRFIACFVEDENNLLSVQGNNIAQFPIEQLGKNKIPRSADVIVVDASSAEYCEKALSLAEEGYSVLLSLPFWNIEMALERFLDLTEGAFEARARRLASVLQLAIGCQLVPGIETSFCGAFEMLSVDSQAQKILRSQEFSELARAMNGGVDKPGMRSMNQSLFQLLIKRKIELKTAFEFSPNPEELDTILKKVGI